MNKLMILTPALSVTNTKAVNKRCMTQNYNLMKPDEYVVYDQEFDEDDYLDFVTYIGHAEKRQGFIIPRNTLLKYFYNSDCDYALLIDANSTVSGPSKNDLLTILDYLRNNNDIDLILSTLGIVTDSTRMEIKQSANYFDVATLYPMLKINHECDWLHCLIMANYKKKYGIEPLISEECDVYKGINEDIYFVQLLKRLFNTYKAPGVIVNKINNVKSSTWRESTDGKYNYPTIDYKTIDKLVSQETKKFNSYRSNYFSEKTLNRVSDYKYEMKPFKSRSKTTARKSLIEMI